MSEKNKWSVVIPTNNTMRMQRAVDSVVNAHDNPGDVKSDIILVDDGVTGYPNRARTVTGIRPFIFSRNVNLGIAAAGNNDVIIMGDDVEVLTPDAFNILRDTAMANPMAAAISAGINGPCANRDQLVRPLPSKRRSYNALAFICVYIPRAWLDKVGPLDEAFTGYGWEDYDWCQRATVAGGLLLVDDHAKVNHNDKGMDSAYRSSPDVFEKAEKAKQIFMAKWSKGSAA